MVISIGSIPRVLDTSLVKADTVTYVSIISIMFLSKALNGVIFTDDPLSIRTLDTDMPL